MFYWMAITISSVLMSVLASVISDRERPIKFGTLTIKPKIAEGYVVFFGLMLTAIVTTFRNDHDLRALDIKLNAAMELIYDGIVSLKNARGDQIPIAIAQFESAAMEHFGSMERTFTNHEDDGYTTESTQDQTTQVFPESPRDEGTHDRADSGLLEPDQPSYLVIDPPRKFAAQDIKPHTVSFKQMERGDNKIAPIYSSPLVLKLPTNTIIGYKLSLYNGYSELKGDLDRIHSVKNLLDGAYGYAGSSSSLSATNKHSVWGQLDLEYQSLEMVPVKFFINENVIEVSTNLVVLPRHTIAQIKRILAANQENISF